MAVLYFMMANHSLFLTARGGVRAANTFRSRSSCSGTRTYSRRVLTFSTLHRFTFVYKSVVEKHETTTCWNHTTSLTGHVFKVETDNIPCSPRRIHCTRRTANCLSALPCAAAATVSKSCRCFANSITEKRYTVVADVAGAVTRCTQCYQELPLKMRQTQRTPSGGRLPYCYRATPFLRFENNQWVRALTKNRYCWQHSTAMPNGRWERSLKKKKNAFSEKLHGRLEFLFRILFSWKRYSCALEETRSKLP